MKLPHAAVAVMLALVLSGCATQAAGPAPAVAGRDCSAEAYPMARLELYFGAERPGGVPVTDAEWRRFLEEEVTPRFPDGLTVLEGYGQWRNSAGVVTREDSILLIVLYEPSAEKETAIEAIRSAYKQRFDQESVMRVDGASCVSF